MSITPNSGALRRALRPLRYLLLGIAGAVSGLAVGVAVAWAVNVTL